MSFLIYDVAFCIIFTIFITAFLIIRKKKVDREGIFIFLYRTSVGMKFIDFVGKKYKKTLKILSYVIVSVGYILMILSIYFLAQIVYIFTKPAFVKAIKLPPLAPLIPYLPSIFKIDWLPPFYFTYWIVAIALVAICHEGFHGIFARYNGIKIKSTGFGFFWPLLSLLFFVEQDDKSMEKKKIFPQLTVLAAGVFANMLLALFFFILLISFLNFSYVPAGVNFDAYSYNIAPLNQINFTSQIITSALGINYTLVKYENKTYLIENNLLNQTHTYGLNSTLIYQNQPAINYGIMGAITEINGLEIKNLSDISLALSGLKPGDMVDVKTKINEGDKVIVKEYNLALGADYANQSRAVLGIANRIDSSNGMRSFLGKFIRSIKDPQVYYESKMNPELAIFIYNFLWWLFLINLSVGIFNMIPAGIFDGGRFLYLTILFMVKDKKLAKKIYVPISFLIILVFILLMVLWVFGMFL